MMIFGLSGRRRLVFFVVGRVEIRRHRFEFGGAGVHQLEDRTNALALAQFPHLLDAVVAFELPLRGDAFVAEAEALQFPQLLSGDLVRCGFLQRASAPASFRESDAGTTDPSR